MSVCLYVWLIDCFKPHEHIFSYLTAVTMSGDWTAKLDLSSALTLLQLLAVKVILHATPTATQDLRF
jgi:hypothetical protein